MKTLEKQLYDDQIGKLNSFERKRFGLKADKHNEGSLLEVKKAVDSVYANDLLVEESDTYEARVLSAELDPTGIIPGEKGPTGPGSLIKVIARIPEVHASLPIPESELCKSHRDLAIAMHPVFYVEQGAGTTLPRPGNVVKVSFPDGSSGQYGRLHGIIDDSESATFAAEISAKDAMENSETPNNRTLADARIEEENANIQASNNSIRAAVRQVKPSDVRTGC